MQMSGVGNWKCVWNQTGVNIENCESLFGNICLYVYICMCVLLGEGGGEQ